MLNKLRNAVKEIRSEDYDLEQTIHERELIRMKVLTDQKDKLAHITRIIKDDKVICFKRCNHTVHYNTNCTHYYQIYKTDCGAKIRIIELNRTAKSEMKIDIHYLWVIWF